MILRQTIESCEPAIEFFGGKLLPHYSSVSTDSRSIATGEIFLALDGPNFRGVTFLEVALNKGSPLVIYHEDKNDKELLQALIKKFPERSFVKVPDTLKYLQDLSVAHSKSWRKSSDLVVIGITGSNGKTTTKEMLFHLLDGAFPKKVIATKGNLNNHIGVPLTLLRANTETSIMIVEMGTNHPGEIEFLCNLVHPDFGIITSVGASHLEFFHNEENVFKEKSSLYRSILQSKHKQRKLVIPMNDAYLKSLLGKEATLSVGQGGEVDATVSSDTLIINLNSRGTATIKNSAITGRHNYTDLALALTLSSFIFPNLEKRFIELAKTFIPKQNRSSWIKQERREIYLDAYNANPSSMRASVTAFIEHLQNIGTPLCDAFFILGDMNELGEESAKYHQEIGAFLKSHGVTDVAFVGPHAYDYKEGFGESGPAFKTKDEFVHFWKKGQLNHKYLFIKASRSLQLESLLGIT